MRERLKGSPRTFSGKMLAGLALLCFAPPRRILRNCLCPLRSRSCLGPAQSVKSAKLPDSVPPRRRSEEHTSELQSRLHLVCRLLLEKKKHLTTKKARSTVDPIM